jgi:hypothetical protein
MGKYRLAAQSTWLSVELTRLDSWMSRNFRFGRAGTTRVRTRVPRVNLTERRAGTTATIRWADPESGRMTRLDYDDLPADLGLRLTPNGPVQRSRPACLRFPPDLSRSNPAPSFALDPSSHASVNNQKRAEHRRGSWPRDRDPKRPRRYAELRLPGPGGERPGSFLRQYRPDHLLDFTGFWRDPERAGKRSNATRGVRGEGQEGHTPTWTHLRDHLSHPGSPWSGTAEASGPPLPAYPSCLRNLRKADYL